MACSSTPRASPANTARDLAEFPRSRPRLHARGPLGDRPYGILQAASSRKVAAGAELTRAEAAAAFDAMLSGEVTPAQMGGFLTGLRVRGESVEEITGAVSAMRAKMLRVKAPDGRHRHRRHRRRRRGLLQRLDAGRDRSSPPAAFPSPNTAIAPRPRRSGAVGRAGRARASRSGFSPKASSAAFGRPASAS